MRLGSKRRLSVRIALCAALVSGAVVVGGSTALADCETVMVDVYDVDLEIARDTYRVGETVPIVATVKREDTGTPVEGAMFAAIVTTGRNDWVVGWNETDVAGEAVAKVKLERKNVRPGPAKLRSIAYKESVDATCAQLVEYGKKDLRNAFYVKR
jgi:hypothetical protein